MKDKYCDEQTFGEDFEREDCSFENPGEDDCQAGSAESGKGKRQKSAERLLLEKEFLELYEEYMHPTKEYSQCRISWQLEDLCRILMDLNRGWAYRTALSYKQSGYDDADGDDALVVSGEYIYLSLKEDREAGNYCSYPIAYYLRLAHNKTIDNYFRKLKLQKTISIDAPISGNDPRPIGEVLPGEEEGEFPIQTRSIQEREEKANRLKLMFVRELLEYPDDPPKPLALMYGNILFQLYKDHGGDDELSVMAKKSTKVSSPEWAHRRMGRATLLQLGLYAERIIQACISKSLSWGSAFNLHMLERTDDGSRRKWADIVYTKTYTEKNTSDWIESIMKSTKTKLARKMVDYPELREYAIELMNQNNKFRKALEKMEKEDGR